MGRTRKQSLRLQGYDYSQPGAYLITTVTTRRMHLLGSVVEEGTNLSPIGMMVEATLVSLPCRYPYVTLDCHVIMPNHVHAVMSLHNEDPSAGDPKDRPYSVAVAEQTGTAPESLGRVIQSFKSISGIEFVRGIRQGRWDDPGVRLWQRNYYDRVIRSAAELDRIRQYIDNNPLQWSLDQYYLPDPRPQ